MDLKTLKTSKTSPPTLYVVTVRRRRNFSTSISFTVVTSPVVLRSLVTHHKAAVTQMTVATTTVIRSPLRTPTTTPPPNFLRGTRRGIPETIIHPNLQTRRVTEVVFSTQKDFFFENKSKSQEEMTAKIVTHHNLRH